MVIAIYTPTIKRKTQEGIDEYTKWMAFKKFLKDFSTFEDYPVPSLIIWEHFMVYATMFGIADLLSVILVFLPLYPKTVGGYVYSVNLFEFIGYECSIGTVYFAVFALLVVLGILKMISARLEANKLNQLFSALSLAVSIAAVLILGLSRQAYAVTVVFLLLTVKGIIILKCNKAK